MLAAFGVFCACTIAGIVVSAVFGIEAWQEVIGGWFVLGTVGLTVAVVVSLSLKLRQKARCQTCNKSNHVWLWYWSWSVKRGVRSSPSAECRYCGADLKAMTV